MDGVIANFAGLCHELGLTGEQLKAYPLAFKRMKPIPGAIEAVRHVISMGYEVWIASKPATGRAQTYADKVEWILSHLPELKRN
ncbi:5' nucleotidase, NT5C type, partial [Escherichia coli]|uniref:5' nucleotidase, NT5C type n=1 Tax=Escherichia coli TaxID=562 RepID=UPI0028DF3884